jgi:hypothetical protein
MTILSVAVTILRAPRLECERPQEAGARYAVIMSRV